MVDFMDGRFEDVWLGHLFPLLSHNDLLRLRLACNQTKDLATRYLWIPHNRGSWELHITSSQDFQDVLVKNLPPPSEIYVFLHDREQPIFETEHVTEFIETYGKHITHLRITNLTIPFTGAKELEFYEGLTNLKSLTIKNVHTGGVAEFERRSAIEGSRLFPPRFRNLKSLQVDLADDLNLTWRFINGMGENLEMLSAPKCSSGDGVMNPLLPLEFIENHTKLKYFDSKKSVFMDNLQCYRLFEACFRNGVKLKSVPGAALECVLVDVNTRQMDTTQVMDPVTGELVYRVNYQRNSFIGDVIHSLDNLKPCVFLMELPFLEELKVTLGFDQNSFRIWRRHGYPSWPNLKKLKVNMWAGTENNNLLNFLYGQNQRQNLEELWLTNVWYRDFNFVNPRGIGRTCGNLKKLTIEHCKRNDNIFIALWEGLPLLESVTFGNHVILGNNGFIGPHVDRPVFMNLQKLKHLKISQVDVMLINDDLFKLVFRNLKLKSFEMVSEGRIGQRITMNGIKTLLTGEFAKSIERLKLCDLKLRDVSAEEMKKLVSLFIHHK